MSDHFVQLTIQSGELHPAFVCTAPGDAACRRRPDDFEDGARESWSAEEATKAGYPCWAVEWVEAVGLPDAIFTHPDGVLVSVPVEIRYSEGVEVIPTFMKSAVEVLADYDALYKVPNEERWIIDGDEAQLAADLAAVVRDLYETEGNR